MTRSVHLTERHEEFRTRVRAVLEALVQPAGESWERDGALPRTAWKVLGDEGLLGLLHPRRAGGTEQDLFTSVVFLEELGRTGFGGFRAAVSVHAYMATHYLARAREPGLDRDWLAPAVRGERVAALAITEPGAGADLSGLVTTAAPDGDHFVVCGVKSMVSNGTTADFHVVAVRTSPPADSGPRGTTGLSLLVVDARLPGITAEPVTTLGWRSAGTATVTYDGVRVPAGCLLGRPGSGFYQLMRGLQLERLVAAAAALGGMDRCLEDTRRFLTERRAFGGHLADLQAPAHRIADLATDLAAARQLVYHAAWLYAQGELPATECSMAKLYTTELACRLADTALQLQGSAGYLDSSAISRIHRDARAATIAAGPSEVMRDLVARSVLRTPAS